MKTPKGNCQKQFPFFIRLEILDLFYIGMFWRGKKLRLVRGGATNKPFKNRYRCQYDFELKNLYLPNKALRPILGGDPELAIQRSSLGNQKP